MSAPNARTNLYVIMAKKYTISGIVQGIGLRPNVKRIAEKYGITGYVKNLGGAVEIFAEGAECEKFRQDIKTLPGSMITSFDEREAADMHLSSFEIAKSSDENNTLPLITPDIAACDRCVEEFYNTNNRRFMHPFISCTYCGPRYSIQSALPYDRRSITMTDFEMCGRCAKEYKSISDIRCHAQTIACRDCGPKLSYTIDGDPLEEASKTLGNGGIVAIKDIGGYHFACGANNEKAAKKLREIKLRDSKPFAVMFNSVEQAAEYAEINETEKNALLSPARPIVLLKKKKDFAKSVCADSDYIGAFLPCNPVQHYLTKMCGALVMTSANVSDEPIITENEDIFKLQCSAGGFEVLSHDRRILTPLDDSVCRVICGRVQMIRRARGFTPLPVEIETKSDKTALALGGDLKASFCYAKDNKAFMSQYFGDLENADTYSAWKSNIKRLGSLLNLRPDIIVSDCHPLYRSGKLTHDKTLQHHCAHMASVMAEHKISGSALGFIFDGTGYGTDGNVWGGEALFFDGEFHRAASLEYTCLLGGDMSAKDSAATLDCYLVSAGLKPRTANGALIKSAVENRINTVQSSSMGRLFDAVSSLLCISHRNSYEGESAIQLERAAERAKEPYPLKLVLKDGKWQTSRLICDIVSAIEDGADINSLALGFHCAIADAVTEFASQQNEKNIVLSGGVYANRILTELCHNALTRMGCRVYINEQVPMNDGGIALGQAWYELMRQEN